MTERGAERITSSVRDRLGAALLAVCAACGGQTDSHAVAQGDGGAAGQDDGGGTSGDAAADGPDHGEPSTTYPAFSPDMPQIQNNGGAIIAAPQVVTITWPGDANAGTFESFGDALPQSQYWITAVSEYGVGTGVSGTSNHVRLTSAPPATMSDTDIASLVTTNTSNAASGWPSPNASVIYVMYLSSKTSLVLQGGDACSQGILGYHSSVMVSGRNVAYAAISQCTGNTVGDATAAASHEIGEAATDPYPQTKTTWIGFDDQHLSWDFFQAFMDEIGDACEFYASSFYTETGDLPYEVQRLWSNKSAAAGHNPCVPVPADVYYNVTPLGLEDVTIDLSVIGGPSTFVSKGYHIALGATGTFSIGFYSDGPTSGAWTVTAYSGNPITGGSTRLTATIDRPVGVNGNKANVTVTVNSRGTSMGELLTLSSKLDERSHLMPILIGSE